MTGRYASLNLLSRFQAELERLMQEAIRLPDGDVTAVEWQPPVDIVETATSILILVDLPGFSAADLTVEVKGPLLLVSGVKPGATPGGTIRFHCVERSQGRFGREIQLLWPVNSHLGSARLAGGLLTIDFPKIKDQRQAARRLHIEETAESSPLDALQPGATVQPIAVQPIDQPDPPRGDA